MYRTLLAVLIVQMLCTPLSAEDSTINTLTVYDLKRDGWAVVEKYSYIETRPGTRSYSNLKRYVQVVEYILEKSKNKYKCIMKYDSQNDTIVEKCIKF